MASFEAETGRDRQRAIPKKKKVIVPIHSNLTPELGFPKKQQRYEKKLRNIIVASFQAKTGWDRLRVIQKKKSNRSDSFQPESDQGISKKQQKNARI